MDPRQPAPALEPQPSPAPERRPALPLDLTTGMRELAAVSPASAALPESLADQPAPKLPPAPPKAQPEQPELATPMPASPGAASGSGTLSAGVREALADAQGLIKAGKPVAARTRLNAQLFKTGLSAQDHAALRTELATLSETLIFSPVVSADDPLTDSYTIASGDTLARITRRQGLPIDWRLLVRINRLSGENAIRVGQKIKLVRLPFHAVVHKNAYRMDIWAGPPASPGATPGSLGQHEGWTYIRSFRVGLGESNGTPEGLFVVRPSSKLVNPRWVNPRTGEVFEADNEANPIGEHWIGLDGADDQTRAFTGYGIHGTIEPASVGQQRSMGCVRLVAPDVAQVYELLVERLSSVRIIK
jgi:lipoprotein-anchoring transpeptidase ErfK/SrfK